jgi:hypothetical protein
VSRFWAEPQRLLIEPDALCVGGSGAERRIAFDGPPDAALGRLAGESAEWIRRGSRWQVVLADALVRYLVIEWPAGLRGRTERAAYVVHRFREVHGLNGAQWQFAIERTATKLPALACAAPAGLADAIGAWARVNRLRLAGVTGEFIAAYNRTRPRITHPHGALAVQRRGRLTVGVWRDAAWQALRSQPLGPAGDPALGLFLESARVRAGADGDGGVLYCVGAMPEVSAGWRTVKLEEEAWA